MNKYYQLLLLLCFSFGYSQTNIKAIVIDKKQNTPIQGVSIQVFNTNLGTTSNKDGFFSLNIKSTNNKIVLSHISYQKKTININTEKTLLDTIFLEKLTEIFDEIIVSQVNSYIKERKNPVALSTFKKEFITNNIGTKDLPEILNTSPSIYATKNGGGYGDVSVNVRGFDQSNVAVLINNIPVNDMETGWVYWSNWLNLPEVTSEVQIQRGLGVSKLAIPSVGGTINILTNSRNLKKGGRLTYQYGSENSHKKTLGYNTGLLKNGFSTSVLFGSFNGAGFVDQTQASYFSYFIDLNYKLSKKQSLQLTILGAPQWHKQHNNASTIEDYLKYSTNNKPNIKYNSEWGFLNNTPFTWSKNYFHKPIVSLNWDWKINHRTKLSTAFYSIFGKGGGTGPIGSINYQYPNDEVFLDEKGQVKFDDIYKWNSGNLVNEFGQNNIPNENGKYINSLNNGLTRYAFISNNTWYGSIINLKHKINPNLKLDIGFDGRITSGKNALTVNNTLGADGYYDNSDINNLNRIIYPNNYIHTKPEWNVFKSIDPLEKIIFYNQSRIKWFSLFSQLEYKKNHFSTFLQAGISNQQFQKTDFFNLPRDTNGDEIVEPQKSKWKYINGGNIKIIANYNIDNRQNIYFNLGYYSKQPLFKDVYASFTDNSISKNLTTEKIKSIELGYGFQNKSFKLKLNTYLTSWKDRFATVDSYYNNENLTGRIYGLKEIHKGIELESTFKYKKTSLDFMASYGNWFYKGNSKQVQLFNYTQELIDTKSFYLNNVKVGNSPQFTINYNIKYNILKNLDINFNQLFIRDLYANIDISNFSNPNHKGSLKLPNYHLANMGINYSFNIPKVSTVNLNLLINNMFNKTYISKSDTNYFNEEGQNSWNGINTKNRVFFGWGRTFNFGISFIF